MQLCMQESPVEIEIQMKKTVQELLSNFLDLIAVFLWYAVLVSYQVLQAGLHLSAEALLLCVFLCIASKMSHQSLLCSAGNTPCYRRFCVCLCGGLRTAHSMLNSHLGTNYCSETFTISLSERLSFAVYAVKCHCIPSSTSSSCAFSVNTICTFLWRSISPRDGL